MLIDLGLAALMGTSDVFSGMGTPGYAPPEQWKAGTAPKVFGSEDVYALGRVIEELGGAPPPDNRWSSRLKARIGLGGGRAPDIGARLAQDARAHDRRRSGEARLSISARSPAPSTRPPPAPARRLSS